MINSLCVRNGMIFERFVLHFSTFTEEKLKNKMNNYVTNYGTTTLNNVYKYLILM